MFLCVSATCTYYLYVSMCYSHLSVCYSCILTLPVCYPYVTQMYLCGVLVKITQDLIQCSLNFSHFFKFQTPQRGLN